MSLASAVVSRVGSGHRAKFKIAKPEADDHEKTSKPRYAEAILISPFFLFAHSKKHFLTIQYADADGTGKFAMIHMDKSNARDIVAAAEAETGKKVERSEEK